MEKLKKVKMMLADGKTIHKDEAMDIGAYYYLLNGKDIQAVKKSDVVHLEYESKIPFNDSSKYVKGEDGSCITGSC